MDVGNNLPCIDPSTHTPLQMWHESVHHATPMQPLPLSQPPPPCKCNPQIMTNCPWNHPQNCLKTHKTAHLPMATTQCPELTPHADRISPWKCPNRWNPLLRPSHEDSVPLGKPTGDTVPTVQRGVYPIPPTNQARMIVKTPAPSVTMPPLCPTRPQLPRPHVDIQMRRNFAVDDVVSWWVHSRVANLAVPHLFEFHCVVAMVPCLEPKRCLIWDLLCLIRKLATLTHCHS